MDPLKGLDFSYHKVLEEGAWDFHTGLGLTETSVVAQWIRDEIRLIAPDFYLGRVYWSNKPLIHFSLQFGAAVSTD